MLEPGANVEVANVYMLDSDIRSSSQVSYLLTLAEDISDYDTAGRTPPVSSFPTSVEGFLAPTDEEVLFSMDCPVPELAEVVAKRDRSINSRICKDKAFKPAHQPRLYKIADRCSTS